MLDKNKLYRVLDFINRYSDENGFPPTVREICKALGIKSTATVYNYLNRLQDMGLLNKADKKRRAVSVRSSTDAVRVPLIGTVTAGKPIFTVENYEGYITLPSSEFGEELFLLRVSGDSMIEAGICNGDKLIVKKQDTAENGDIIVSMFDDGISDGATVKRFFRRDGKIILHPENPTMSDFVLDRENDVKILGKVVGLLRTY